jgi:hypothetical protein
MNIDRSNYQIWLIDWLDGNLNEIQVEQLKYFLSENPDLKEESEDLKIFRLNPSGKPFQYKNHLNKTAANLSGSQFDYLSAAYLENDLSSDQETELMEIIDQDPERKMAFELIQKARLSPLALSYKHKHRLIRRTIVQNVIRLSLIGLSAAAIITLAVIIYISKPGALQVKIEKTSQAILPDTSIKKPAIEIVSEISKEITSERKITSSKKQSNNMIAVSRSALSTIPETQMNTKEQEDSLVRSADLSHTLITKIPVSQEISLKGDTIYNTLIALNSKVTAPEYDDERSKVRRFIAKTFREKILKEKTAKDSPLKAYEIAEAGVSGLNKLLGWEMALDEKKDANGELKSVYFSSKILKFNARVKKTEPLQ